MGYWKDVAYDISRGMSRKMAEKVNAKLRYGNLTEEERKQINTEEEKTKLIAEGEADIKLNSML